MSLRISRCHGGWTDTITGDKHRTTGLHANAAMHVDPILKNTCLVDVTGGSAVFYDTRVNVVKA